MKITIANRQAIQYACLNFHYSKSVPVNTLGYNIYNDNDEWCGVILYGTGANHNIGNEYNIPQGGVLELVRVALNGKQKYTSKALSLSLKELKKNCPLCKMVISYADIDQDHLGTIYQATNWIFVGKTNENTKGTFIINGKKTHPKSIYSKKIIVNGKKIHCPHNLDIIREYIDPDAESFISKGKYKYIMPFDKKIKKQIMKLSQPYPKNDENWNKIDRKTFK